jgi:hypothetical protein
MTQCIIMTKGELTARRKATECGRHALLAKSGGWQKAATREFEAKAGARAEGRPGYKETEDRATQGEGWLGWVTPRSCL